MRKALEDNFDTASALLALLSLSTATNVYITTVKAERSKKVGYASLFPRPQMLVWGLCLPCRARAVQRERTQ